MKELFPAGGKLLLAVSGGVDSMCMAELCLRAGLSIELAHCNFSLRGEESDGDQSLVEAWCGEHGVQLNTVRFDTLSYASSKGISTEMAARELRYGWFASVCEERGCCAVAVAHNANDNAETLVLNLLRGTGTRGLCGMKADGLLPVPGSSVRLVRPLLRFTREEIEGFALSQRLSYRFDGSNADNSYKRNRVRNEIFPLFARINPSFLKTFSAEMEHFSQAQEVLDACFLEWKATVVISDEPLTVSIDALLSSPHWEWLLFRFLEPYGFNASVMDSLAALLVSQGAHAGRTFLCGEYSLVTTSSAIVVSRISESPAAPTMVFAPGVYEVGGRKFIISLEDWPSCGMPLKQPEGVLIMDAARLSFPFVLRRWQEGDWFVPFGMKGSKKLSDYFTDKKMSLITKSSAVIAAASDAPCRIHAVLCLRSDDSLRVTPSTSQVVVIKELS